MFNQDLGFPKTLNPKPGITWFIALPSGRPKCFLEAHGCVGHLRVVLKVLVKMGPLGIHFLNRRF